MAEAAADVIVVRAGGSVPDVLKNMQVVSSVNEAMRAASSGTTVHVLPGEYRESVVLDKDVTLVGFGYSSTGGVGAEENALKARIIGSDAGPALTVKSCKATVRGLWLENPSLKKNALEVLGGIEWMIEGCNIRGKGQGIGYEWGGIVIRDGKGTIRACNISECGENGILVKGNSDVLVEKCTIARHRFHGVCVLELSRAQLVDCECLENGDSGVVAHNDSKCAVERCRLVNNGYYGAWRFSPTCSLTLDYCTLNDNKKGERKGC
jgi:nitrous oxidase accessory protein NosD